ncbi:cytochrome P450 82G1-like [Herrania umbratica]|uniref:Cytochrome P450 82G1-like n=1 Tax=Herrania umbratica TaxID=108875 RepID=A0A6J1BPS7_9ROSI|nr:cytochrome P450 82G1-like [Herrania umbratica]
MKLEIKYQLIKNHEYIFFCHYIPCCLQILTMTGGESTSVTMTWVLSLLLNHPSVLKTAQQELDLHVGIDRWVEESDIKSLKYLQAIVKETLRLYPPGPITGIREAMEDCCIAGHHVPKGTRLIVNLWKLQRDPRVWENPGTFQPERFLTTHADFDVRSQNFEYIPFSSGRRSCPAINFGLQVVHLTLAKLLQGFDIRTPDGKPVDMGEGLGLALPKRKPLDVVLTPRLAHEFYKCL